MKGFALFSRCFLCFADVAELADALGSGQFAKTLQQEHHETTKNTQILGQDARYEVAAAVDGGSTKAGCPAFRPDSYRGGFIDGSGYTEGDTATHTTQTGQETEPVGRLAAQQIAAPDLPPPQQDRQRVYPIPAAD